MSGHCLPADFTDEHRANVCKIGQGAECCRYLTMGASGWSCEKRTSMRWELDRRAVTMSAKGDNCGGVFTPLPAFVLTAERFGNPAGTVIYRAKGYDYGLANDDFRATGQPHSSMTLEPSGDYPTFTVPDSDYRPTTPTAEGVA